jgi:hypothetical protein
MKNKLFTNIICVAFTAYLLTACTSCGLKVNGKGKVFSHADWTNLLKKHVAVNGLVNYKGFIADSVLLNNYLKQVSENPPAKKWAEQDKIAYWINAYNAYTVKLIVDNYPVKSIKDLGPDNQIIFINTPWDKKFFKIGNRSYTLNNIEHRVLRANFKEPRIHFALNCASMSCPKLRAEAYEGVVLDKQLTEQGVDFLSDSTRNIMNAQNPKLSNIFNWYGGDFRKWSGKTVKEYVSQFSEIKINENANVDYLKYDWSLNDSNK